MRPIRSGLFVLACLAVLPAAQAQTILRASQFGSGGARLTGTNNTLIGTLGQPLAGFGAALRSGFWYVASAGEIATGVEEDLPGEDAAQEQLPREFRLRQNYPNPFNPSTTITYDLPEPTSVRLEIFDGLGRLVRVLVNAEQATGTYRALWDGRDAGGRTVSTGLYIYRLATSAFTRTRSMLLVK